MSKTITSALRKKIRENGGSANKATDIKHAIDQLDGVGGGASSAKLDEIIAAKGVGVRTKKTDEEVLNLTVHENEWTVEDNFMDKRIQSDFEPQVDKAYKVLVDGVEYTAISVINADFGNALYVEELDLGIYARKGALTLSFYSNLVPADHTFVIIRTYGVSVSFTTPEAEEWLINDKVAYSKIDIIPLAIGEEYVVTWDGVEYPVTAAAAGEDDGPVFIGNKSIPTAAEDTGEPFCYLYAPAPSSSIFVRSSDAGVHTVTIARDEYEYQKIDEKYLSGGYDVIIAVNGSDTFQYLKGSYNVIAELLSSINSELSNEDVIRLAETKIAFARPSFSPVGFSVVLAVYFSFDSGNSIIVKFPDGFSLILGDSGTISPKNPS